MQFSVFAENLRYLRDGLEVVSISRWAVRPGEHWVLLGPNGCGKTSLIKMITLYEWPAEGRLMIQDAEPGSKPTSEIRNSIGIFEPFLQSDVAAIPDYLTATDILCTGFDGSLRPYNEYSPEQRKRASALTESHFQNKDIAGREWHLLSSGEKRRILLLRTILNNPDFVILDEPYEFLDIKARIETEKFFNRYFSENKSRSSLTVLHRTEEIPAVTTHAALMKSGQIVYQGPVEEIISSENLSDVFGMKLLVRKQESHFSCTPII